MLSRQILGRSPSSSSKLFISYSCSSFLFKPKYPSFSTCSVTFNSFASSNTITTPAVRARLAAAPSSTTINFRSARATYVVKAMSATKHRELSSVDELCEYIKELGVNERIPEFEGSDPLHNPVDVFRCYIAEELAKISGVDRKLIYPALEWTSDFKKGDLIIAVPRLKVKGNPQELAKDWAEKFPQTEYSHPPVAHGAFLQFHFKAKFLAQLTIPTILHEPKTYGANKSGVGKKVLVEFSSVNIAKPFHAGHLRSTIIGGFLSNLHELCGWEVIRMNYLGDWGKQFGLLAVGFDLYGDLKKLEEDPIQHLFEIYVRINKEGSAQEEALKAGTQTFAEGESIHDQARAHFKKMEDGDEKALEMWKRFRELSIVKAEKVYDRLNIKFDIYSGESQVSNEVMKRVGKELEEKKISEDSEGAKLIDFTKHGAKKLGKAIIQKKDGTTLYLTRDIGAAIERYETYNFDKMIYVVASQQDLHLAQLFKILELMGYDWASKCSHVNFGMVLGMKTRSGEVVFLDSILNEVAEAMHVVMKKNEEKYQQVENPDLVADLVGKAAVMVQDMSGKRVNNYPFDITRMTSFEGDTGPYLQYAHSRLSSILRKASIPMDKIKTADLSLLEEQHATNLLRCLAQYPDVVKNTLKTQEPCTVMLYLFKLTHLLSSSYDSLRVIGGEENVSHARMALYESVRVVLHNGMVLLGMTPVERM